MARGAIACLGDMFATMQRAMEQVSKSQGLSCYILVFAKSHTNVTMQSLILHEFTVALGSRLISEDFASQRRGVECIHS